MQNRANHFGIVCVRLWRKSRRLEDSYTLEIIQGGYQSTNSVCNSLDTRSIVSAGSKP